MAQCFTNPTLTLFGTTVSPGEPGKPTYSTSTYYLTVLGTPIPYETSTCDGGYKGGYTDACSHYSTFTAFSTGPPVTSTFYDIITIAPEAGGSITSTFPTETRYTTSCTTTPDPNKGESTPTTPVTPTTPQAVTTPTPPAVATPSTVLSVGLSSNPVTITNSAGVVSVSVQIKSVSVVFTSNVPAVATGVSALKSNNSSSTPIGPIVGGVVGGLAVLGAIVALVLFLRRKSKKNQDNNDYDYDDGYGTVRRSTDRGEKVERKRMDLVAEDANPGFVQPFPYSDSSYNQTQQHTYPSNGPTSFSSSSYTPVPTSSSPPPPPHMNDFGPSQSFAGAAGTYPHSNNTPSSQQNRSPPTSMTSAQAKALEAQRSRSGAGSSSSSQSAHRGGGASSTFVSPGMGRNEEEEEEQVVVHEDAGPARVELPPVYVDRS